MKILTAKLKKKLLPSAIFRTPGHWADIIFFLKLLETRGNFSGDEFISGDGIIMIHN